MRSITAAALVAATCFAVAQASPAPQAATAAPMGVSAELSTRIAELEATVDLLETVALDQQAEIQELKAAAQPTMTTVTRMCEGTDGIC